MNVDVLPPSWADCHDYVWHTVPFTVERAPNARLIVQPLRWPGASLVADGGAA